MIGKIGIVGLLICFKMENSKRLSVRGYIFVYVNLYLNI